MITTKYFYFALDLLGISCLDLLVQELTAVHEKWQHIGEKLGVNTFSLRDIRTDYSDQVDCLREVLKERLQMGSMTTWGDIIAVLRSSHIAEFQLADQLEAKYYPSKLIKFYNSCNIWEHVENTNSING